MTRGAVFITGGTGYMGYALIPELTSHAHEVIALVRQQSTSRLPPNCRAVMGDPLKRKNSKPNHSTGALE